MTAPVDVFEVELPLKYSEVDSHAYYSEARIPVRVRHIRLDMAWLEREFYKKVEVQMVKAMEAVAERHVQESLRAHVDTLVRDRVSQVVAEERERIFKCLRAMSPHNAEDLIAALSLSDPSAPAKESAELLGGKASKPLDPAWALAGDPAFK